MGTVRLLSVRPGHGTADLAAWDSALAGVRVVGLGEATHGTGEFFSLKHRLIAHLVREHRTRVVAFEASEAASTVVDRWIVAGDGDPTEALRGLGFWTWDTVEVLDLLAGLREINRERLPADRVRFVGVDPQRPELSVVAVADWLRASGHDDLASAVDAVTAPASFRGAPLDGGTVTRVREGLAVLAAADGIAAPLLRHALRVARSTLLASAPDAGQRFAVRDRLMARGVLDVVDPRHGPVAFWAHNGHVQVRHDPVATAGAHLRERLGRGYYALGLLAGSGRFRARRSWGPLGAGRRIVEHDLGDASPPTVEHRLLAADGRDRLLDIRDLGGDSWLHDPAWTRSHGATAPFFPALAVTPVTPTEAYDGLAVLATTGPSRPTVRS